MKLQSFCTRKCNLDVEIHFTKIDHTKLGLRVILLEICLEITSRRVKKLCNVSSNFQLQKLNVTMLIFEGIKRDGKYIFLTLQCTWVS